MRRQLVICTGLLCLNRFVSAQVTDAGRFFAVEPVATVGRGAVQDKVGRTGAISCTPRSS